MQNIKVLTVRIYKSIFYNIYGDGFTLAVTEITADIRSIVQQTPLKS